MKKNYFNITILVMCCITICSCSANTFNWQHSAQKVVVLKKKNKGSGHTVKAREHTPEVVASPPRYSKPSVADTVHYNDKIFGNYYALLIGNDHYRTLRSLKTAKHDALSLSALLRKSYGFKVKVLTDASRNDIITALAEYRKTLTVRDNLLVYYAGHGWLDNEADEGYWLPVDAEKDNPANWLSNSTITASLRAMSAKHVLVIADSCYSGKLTRGIHINLKSTEYLTRISKKRARTALASGGLEPVADGSGKGNHSIFTSALLDVLSGNNQKLIDLSSLFPDIRKKVMLNADQTPEYSDIRKAGHEGGDFIFKHQ